jgi:hypothetical protein
MPELEVNYRSCKFGWAWTTTPTGEDAYSIEFPIRPMYEGTLKQIADQRDNDRAFHSLGGAFYNTAYFYDGQRITHTWGWDIVLEPPADEAANMTNDEFYATCKYGYRWRIGFHPEEGKRFKIRTVD